MTPGRSVPEATCGRYTLVAQREGTLTERDDGALEIQAESPYLVRGYDGMELSRVIEQVGARPTAGCGWGTSSASRASEAAGWWSPAPARRRLRSTGCCPT